MLDQPLTAHLIFGHVGVGKPTFARRIADQAQGVVFDGDVWVGRLYGRNEGSVADFGTALGRVEDVILDVWSRCLAVGVDLVLDLGFWSRAKRDAYRAQIEAVGAEHVLYEVVADPDAAWTRVAARPPPSRSAGPPRAAPTPR